MLAGGAAVALTQSDIILIGNTFKQNSAEVGGAAAIFCESYSNITIINSRFEGNHATDHGGALYCQSGCIMTVQCYSTFNSNAAIREQELDRNENACTGGAFTVVGGAKVDINESKFSNNKAARDGGPIHA